VKRSELVKTLWLCVVLVTCSCVTGRGKSVPIMVAGDVVRQVVVEVRVDRRLTIQELISMAGGGTRVEDEGRRSAVLHRRPGTIGRLRVTIGEEKFSTPLSELDVNIAEFEAIVLRTGRF
jgi:hypothetical protein